LLKEYHRNYSAIEDTTKALTAAGKLPSPYSAGAVFQPANNPDVSSAFGAAEQSLKACFESYQVKFTVPLHGVTPCGTLINF